MTEDQLSALLRLKRFEQPPPGYFDKLLTDVHRRQRAELLRRPLWRIALDRLQTYFGEHSMGSLTYAGAMAALVVCGISFISLINPGPANHNRGAATQTLASLTKATAEPATTSMAPQTASVQATQTQPVNLLLDNQTLPAPTTLGNTPFQIVPRAARDVRHPRYVIDARPASYEATPVSFSF